MKAQLKIPLLIFANFGSVVRYWGYVPKLKALGYQNLLDDPTYSGSAILAALHFRRFGVNEISRGDRPLDFTVQGKTYRYNEEMYRHLYPGAEKLVKAGVYPNLLSHFVMVGYPEMVAGRETSYLNEYVQEAARLGMDAMESGWPRFTVTDDGKEYDYVEDLYLKEYPEAQLAVRAGKFQTHLQHYFCVTRPRVLKGEIKLYSGDYTPKVLKIIEGQAKSGKNLCLFAHYDADGDIDPFVIRYLDGLRSMDCEVVFISGTARETELAKIAHLCSEFILRNEYGFYFGSWYLAVKQWKDRFSQYEHVIWANDSVYFPLHPVEGLADKMTEMLLDVWGIHESREQVPYFETTNPRIHTQSFFMGFSQRAIKAGILDDFLELFDRHPVLSEKGQTRVYEYWTSIRGMELGLRVGALCKFEVMYDAFAQRNPDCPPIHVVNPTIHLWRQSQMWFKSPVFNGALLLEGFPCIADVKNSVPGLKKQIFDLSQLGAMIDPEFYDINLILRHSARVATGPRPVLVPVVDLQAERQLDRSPFSEADTLCVFNHYDKKGIIRPYVLRYLQDLEEVGCEFIFVTAISRDEELAKLPPSCRRIIVKTKASEPAIDFGAYWLALKDLKTDELKFKRYMVANDSVFFSLADHKRMFAEMIEQSYDMWGVVDSYEVRWHVQSYMWNFSAECFKNGFLPTFLSEYRKEGAKWDLIRNYEMRYPGLMREKGYKVGAYIPIEAVSKAVVKLHQEKCPNEPLHPDIETLTFNPHYIAWDLIITDFNCPTLKIGLLRDHKDGGAAMYELKSLIQTQTNYDYSLIADVFGDPNSGER